MSSLIFNEIPNIESYSYLELGVCNNFNFNAIRASNKMSVDINGKAMYTGTTDSFFSSLAEDIKFDLIYIDANHNCDYLIRDYNNSIKHCNKLLLIHDMIPPSEFYCQEKYCSDSYKVLYYMWGNSFNVYPMEGNMGATFVYPPFKSITNFDFYQLSYASFKEGLSRHRTYTTEEVKAIIST